MTPLEIRPLDGAGAEILGANLGATTVGEWNQIEAAFAAFGAIFFPDQLLNEEETNAFASRWGTVTPAPEATGPEFQGWQADRSFLPFPPLGSVNTPLGGAKAPRIRLASMYAAFDGLTTGTQNALEALSATHTSPDGNLETTHPVVIRHPISGRKSLFVNPSSTTAVVGMDDVASMALLNELFSHCQADEFVVEAECEPGCLALIDHRAMLRYFYDDSRAGSQFQTVSIAGCALAPAVRPDKSDRSLTQKAAATLAGGIITAAMAGIAEVMEPEKRKQQDIEIVSDAPEREPLDADFDFGDLPPLD